MDEKASIHLDIILPCFNPRKDWHKKVCEAVKLIQHDLPDKNIRLILVNDGSSRGIEDAQVEFIRQNIHPSTFQYLQHSPNQGKGFALRKGVESAKGSFQIFTDIDFPYTHDSFLRIYRDLVEGKGDVVPGVRDESYYAGVPPFRKFISRTLRKMLKTFLRLKVTDTQCGLKGFNAKGRRLFLETRINRFLFDMEFLFLASNQPDIQIKACEVELKPEVIFTKVNWKILVVELVNFLSIFTRFVFRKRS